MVYLPNEIVNHIIMFRQRHPLFMRMKYLNERINRFNTFVKNYFNFLSIKKQIHNRNNIDRENI